MNIRTLIKFTLGLTTAILMPLSVYAINVTVPASPSAGSVLYGLSSGNYTTLPIGSGGTCLTSNGSVPSWSSCGSGGGGGAGTFSTTTSGGHILQYPYTTLVTSLDGSATSTSDFWFDPFISKLYVTNASTTALTVTGIPYFTGISAGGLSVDANGKLYNFSTSTWKFASSTLLSDNNTFSGTNKFLSTITGSISGNAGTVTNGVYTTDTGTVTNTMLAGSIAASKLIGTDIATVGTITSGTWNGTTIDVAHGGTGSTTLTGILKGNGTSQVQTAANGTDYTLLISTTCSAGSALTGVTADGGTTCGNAFSTTSADAYINASTTIAHPAGIASGNVIQWNGTRWVSVATSTLGLGGSGGGSVTSVDASGGTTGLTFTGGPITTSGTLTLGGTLNVANGGTGASAFGQGWIYSSGGTTALAASTSPTINYLVATSTKASILPYASTTALTVSGSAYVPSATCASNTCFLVANTGTGDGKITGVTTGYSVGQVVVGGSSALSGYSGLTYDGTKLTATYASSTAISTSYASSTSYYGSGLTTCNSSAKTLSWTGGLFGCNSITANGLGGGSQYQVLTTNGLGVSAWTALSLDQSAAVTGILPIANGGTNASSIGASSTVALSNGTAYTFMATSSLGIGWTKYSGYSLATTTTWTGSTTEQQVYTTVVAETWQSATCNTLNAGTVNIQFYNNSAKMTMIPASSTPATYMFSANNSIAAGATTTVIAGTPASSPTSFTCTIKRYSTSF